MSKEICVEVEHKAHRTGKDKKEMSHSERFVTDGNEKAHGFAKEGALWEKGLRHRQEQKRSNGKRRRVRSLAVCRQLSLLGRKEKWIFVDEIRGNEASNGVMCCEQKVSVQEV